MKGTFHHGRVIDQALRRLHSTYVLFVDSDSEVTKSGFVEMMLTLLEANPRHHVVGNRIFMNKSGFYVSESRSGHPYIRPICMLIKRQIYLTLPPFARPGATCLENMISAVENENSLIHFPINEYVNHKGRGTATAGMGIITAGEVC